jgi:hypothetical protein
LSCEINLVGGADAQVVFSSLLVKGVTASRRLHGNISMGPAGGVMQCTCSALAHGAYLPIMVVVRTAARTGAFDHAF